MPELKFFIEGVEARPHTLVPSLTMKLRVINATPEPVHSLLVRCQVQLDAPRRRYNEAERLRLRPLFAEPARWERTLRPLHWQTATALVGAFTGTTVAEVELPCSLDFSLGATQYLAALEGEPVPLRVFFSGTLFYTSATGVQATPIAWNLEARYAMPAAAWRDAARACCGEWAWLPLRPEVFDRLARYRAGGFASWEAALEALLPEDRAQHQEAA